MIRVTFVQLLALPIGLLATAAIAAQQPAAPEPQALTYEMAVQVIDAAEARLPELVADHHHARRALEILRSAIKPAQLRLRSESSECIS